MEKDWVKIYESSVSCKVNLAKDILEDNEINCVIIDKLDSMYKGFTNETSELYVNVNDKEKANQILKNQNFE